jgi:hypothetical protein
LKNIYIFTTKKPRLAQKFDLTKADIEIQQELRKGWELWSLQEAQ